MKLKKPLFLLASFAISLMGYSQSTESENIRLNQIGFYPKGPKKAIIVNSPNAKAFALVSAGNPKDTVFRGKLVPAGKWQWSEEEVSQADFTKFETSGDYILAIPGVGNSYPFSISNQVLLQPAKASVKGFYFQRASIALSEQFAGKWARNAGHPDTAVFVHNSAASNNRPAGTIISSSKGWYDAGDYNKYIVNSGITMGTLLATYENFPTFLDTLNLNIPESTNNIPDFLDEVLWNLRWMLTMQDPEDGGVYHKLTNPNFDGSVTPERATNIRYVVQKGTAASLDFAAVMAQASRVFKKFPKELPGLSDSCLKAAEAAYAWAKKSPDVAYEQSALKEPSIQTGAYDDKNFNDELLWAGLELYITTGKANYKDEARIAEILTQPLSIPSWQNVHMMGIYSLLRNKSKLSGDPSLKLEEIKEKVLKFADEYKNSANSSPYSVPMGISKNDFEWGSNSVAANQGILLLYAYQLTLNKSYLNASIANMDYLLGRNATGYSFLTGYGEKSTKNPHHRPSESDKNKEPVPGLLAGGPNPGQQDTPHCKRYKEKHKYPATSYIDEHCSYASNEIAINWNAPFAYQAIAIEALETKPVKKKKK